MTKNSTALNRIVVALALIALLLFSSAKAKSLEQSQVDQQKAGVVSLSGDQAGLLNSVLELAYQPFSERKFRLVHRKFLNKMIPEMYVALAWSGVNPAPTPAEREVAKEALDFYLQEVGQVMRDHGIKKIDDIEAWNGVPRVEIVNLVMRLLNGLQNVHCFSKEIFDIVHIHKEVSEISSVNIEIQQEAGLVKLNFESIAFTFHMVRKKKVWQLASFVEKENN